MDGEAEIKNWNKSSSLVAVLPLTLEKNPDFPKKNPEKTQIFDYKLANT